MKTYWYCMVRIEGVSKEYYYISRRGELPEGTEVFVPFGQNNVLKKGIVQSCVEYTEDMAPYPVCFTKYIISKSETEKEESCPFRMIDCTVDEVIDDCELADRYISEEDWDMVMEWAYYYYDSSDEKLAQKAIECYKAYLEHDISEAALALEAIYYGRTFEEVEKIYLYNRLAADAGVQTAIRVSGDCAYYGKYQQADDSEAFKYYSAGALLYNDLYCLYKLGDMYLTGTGTKKNERYAFLIYERALKCAEEEKDEHYMPELQFRVGKCLVCGIGTYEDTEKGHELLSLALVSFYKRRRKDRFVAKPIESIKELLAQAQKKLDREMTDYQREWDVRLDDFPPK